MKFFEILLKTRKSIAKNVFKGLVEMICEKSNDGIKSTNRKAVICWQIGKRNMIFANVFSQMGKKQ